MAAAKKTKEEKKDDKKSSDDIKQGDFHKWLGKSPMLPITQADVARGMKAHDPSVRKMAQSAKKAMEAKAKKADKKGKGKVAHESADPVPPAWSQW